MVNKYFLLTLLFTLMMVFYHQRSEAATILVDPKTTTSIEEHIPLLAEKQSQTQNPPFPPQPQSPPDLSEIVESYFPYPHTTAAMKVMMCESSGNPDAVGDGGDSLGLFQIQPKWWSDRKPAGSPFDPAVNIECAYNIWQEYGWKYWSCKP